MTDDSLRQFLFALDAATEEFQHAGLPWTRLIRVTTGHEVLTFDEADPLHVLVLQTMAAAAEMVVDDANSTAMSGWGLRRVNEMGNALETRFTTAFNQLGGQLVCRSFPQSTGYPDRRLLHGSATVAYVDLKTYESGSQASRFRSFYHQPRQARSKIDADALHLLLAFPHTPNTKSPWDYSRLDGYHVIDLSELRLKLKGEFQASNFELYSGPMLRQWDVRRPQGNPTLDL